MKVVIGLVLLSAIGQVTAFAPSAGRMAFHKSSASALSMSQTVDDKTEVREYFNTEGFNRWNKIYSDSDEVNSVQLDIRNGHDQTIQKIIRWIEQDADIMGKTVCDCGCGVGSLAIPLAQMGKLASAVRTSRLWSIENACRQSANLIAFFVFLALLR